MEKQKTKNKETILAFFMRGGEEGNIGNGPDEWLGAKSGSCWTGSNNSFSSGEDEMCNRSNMNILILRTDWIGSFYAARPF